MMRRRGAGFLSARAPRDDRPLISPPGDSLLHSFTRSFDSRAVLASSPAPRAVLYAPKRTRCKPPPTQHSSPSTPPFSSSAHDASRRNHRKEADARDHRSGHVCLCERKLEVLREHDTRPDNPSWLAHCRHVQNRLVQRPASPQGTAGAPTPRSCIAPPVTRVPADTPGRLHRQLARAWSQLPVQAQGIAQQVLLDGDTEEEVSRRFGITRGGVASSIHRTREHLRQAMFGT